MDSVFLSRENVDADHADSSTVQHMIRVLNSKPQHVKPKDADSASFSRLQHMKKIKPGHTIFKVPQSIKKLELDAFVPHIVSIGPYHWHEQHLKDMETYKSILLDHVLTRAGKELETLRKKMSKFEEATRKHYDQPCEHIEHKDFVDMMLRDACFILELFCVKAGWNNPSGWLHMKGFMPFIKRDLLMLENQLPLFVLQEMFTLLDWRKTTPNESIHSLAIKFFDQLNRPPPPPAEEADRPSPPPPPKPEHLKNRPPAAAEENRSPPPPENSPPPPPHSENRPPPPPPQPPHPKNKPSASPRPPPRPPPPPPPPPLHLLDIVHQSLRPSPSDKPNTHWTCTIGNCLISSPISLPCFSITICVQDSERERVSSDPPDKHSVTSLRSTGIGFEENKNWKKLTDIQFDHKNGMLLIPRLHINGSTKSILLNLMVFEQGSPYCGRYITSYTSFMDGLVDSPKDALYLIEKRIIYHELGSEEDVATLFNNLRREIYFKYEPDDYYLYDVSQKLNKHYEQKWRSWIATLKHEYLKDPWKTVSLFAAALLIILTAAQTAYTVVGYHFPRP
ncbi:UPF0481 protein [Camellia lanceoleosa]|uniref:UPF0481 protein n=1 Tax=Camellia lanceoleosa TaxID=1840588 RepID=A0ACC0FDF5_9ERIC|nr:UPF0481 protein [Camellia lanceoleosa]